MLSSDRQAEAGSTLAASVDDFSVETESIRLKSAPWDSGFIFISSIAREYPV